MTTTATKKAQSNSISLWKNQKQESSLRLYGQIQVTPEMIQQLSQQEPDQYGRLSLKVALFKNTSTNPKAPLLTGRIELPEAKEAEDEY